MYEAEAGEKNDVAAWLLTGGKGLESAAGGGHDEVASGTGGEADAEGRIEVEGEREEGS